MQPPKCHIASNQSEVAQCDRNAIDPSSVTQVATTADRNVQAGRNILIVDDNAPAARLLALLLERIGPHTVRTAADAVEALASIESFTPELLLLDIGLPGMNGFELAKEIRGRAGFEQALLVAVTGYGQEAYRRQSREAGFDEHCLKPISMHEIEVLLNHPKLATPKTSD